MFALPLCIHFASQRCIHLWSTELLGLKRFLTLWRVFLHHICELSAVLDFQGVKALLHWPHGAAGSNGSTYSSPSYSMALPLKKTPILLSFGPVMLSVASPLSESFSGVTDSKTLHGVSFQRDGLAWSTAACRKLYPLVLT